MEVFQEKFIELKEKMRGNKRQKINLRQRKRKNLNIESAHQNSK